MKWIAAHPDIVWPLVTAILTAIFKRWTPESYATLPPRWAAFMKLIGSLGVDVPNLVESIKQLVKGHSVPAAEYRAQRGQTEAPPPAAPDGEAKEPETLQ